MNNKYLLVLLLIVLPLVSAQPPFQESSATYGYDIAVPESQIVQLDRAHQFNLHVFNRTDGSFAKGVSCGFHLYNITGHHIATLHKINTSLEDYEFDLNANNFSIIGNYYYVAQCNSSTTSGFTTIPIVVTRTGDQLSISGAIIYIFVELLIIAIFTMLMIVGIKTSSINPKDNYGDLLNINWNKYIKVFVLMLAYMTFVLFSYFSYNIVLAYTPFEAIANYFYYIHRISYILLIPIGIAVVILSVIKFVREWNIHGQIERGLRVPDK